MSKVGLGNMFLLVNAFAWFSCAPIVIDKVVETIALTSNEKLVLYLISFLGASISILLGASLVSRCNRKNMFLLCWTLSGAMCSAILTILVLLAAMTLVNILIISFLLSISFGFGLAAAMGSFAKCTLQENRARSGSIVLLSIFLGTFILRSMLTNNILSNSLLITLWRAFGLVAFAFTGMKEEDTGSVVTEAPSLTSILKERPFALYLIPWTIFSLVNYLSWYINANIYGEELIHTSVLIENILVGVSAIIAGLVSDTQGRKLVTLVAFTLFGLGYAVLGIYPSNIISWHFYVVMDGVSWGMISVIFVFTIWGDLARGGPSEKHYAIGIFPYSLSNFLRLVVGPFVAEVIPHYAIFSFAAFFLFLAVLPLMFAPETLPEKIIRERELKSYIERAKRVREKFTKG